MDPVAKRLLFLALLLLALFFGSLWCLPSMAQAPTFQPVVAYYELVEESDYNSPAFAVTPYVNVWVKRDPAATSYILEVGGPEIQPVQEYRKVVRDYHGWVQYHVDLTYRGSYTAVSNLTLVAITPWADPAGPVYGNRTNALQAPAP